MNQESTHKLRGDITNTFVLVGTLVYLFVVVYFTLPGAQGVVDEHWKEDGFCIQNMDVPYWSSFDTCLYVDVTFSFIIAALYFRWKDIPGMEKVNAIVPAVIASTLGHGAAHGAMATGFRDGSYQENKDSNTVPEPVLWQQVAFCAMFWFPLLKGVNQKMSNFYLAILAVMATYGNYFVKTELGFPYVQTVINVSFHISQLMLPLDEKSSRFYMRIPLANVLPLLVAWSEALFCDAFFRAAGGHMLYDASIVVSFLALYITEYNYYSSKPLAKEKTS